MKLDAIEEFAKLRKKEQRMKIDKIKESARQQDYDRYDKKAGRVLLEKHRHDEQYIGE